MTATRLDHLAHQDAVHAHPEGEAPKRFGASFFRGETLNFNPYGADHGTHDFAQRFALRGWLPQERFIAKDTRVTAFGSCFAQNISNYLAKMGFDLSGTRSKDIYISAMGEGLVNVHSIVQQFRWALEDWTPPAGLWHGYRAEEHGISEEIRLQTRDIMLNSDVFILTFGLSEIWYDEVTGGIFWRAVPMRVYDPARHKFRVCSFAETKGCIAEVLDLIARHVPHAKVVMTVSPIPLVATFRPVSCLTANAASKALIKSAMDEVLRERAETGSSLFYFPAYELVNEAFPNRFGDDGRHLDPRIVPAIMKLFEAGFCRTDLSFAEAEASLRAARLENARTLHSHPFYGDAISTR